MKKTLLLVLVAIMAPLSANAAGEVGSLVGAWQAKKSASALGGTAEFRKDGTFTLTPDGAGAAEGKYTLDGDHLVLRLNSSPQFPADGVIEFADKGGTLRIQYAKGPNQEFSRLTSKKVRK